MFSPSRLATTMSAVHFYCVLCGAALQTSAEEAIDFLRGDEPGKPEAAAWR